MKIIVISNSKDLLKKEYGEVVDQYEFVVRFNNYEIEGFEKYVGKKTSIIYARCCEDIKIRPLSSFEHIYFVQPPCRYLSAMKQVGYRFQSLYQNKCSIVGPKRCAKVHQELGLGNPDNEWPSIGIIGLSHLLDTFDQLDVLGWNYGASTHYFQKQPRDAGFHNWKKEEVLFEKWVKEGKVVHLENIL